jgi:hypothetical protein
MFIGDVLNFKYKYTPPFVSCLLLSLTMGKTTDPYYTCILSVETAKGLKHASDPGYSIRIFSTDFFPMTMPNVIVTRACI